MYLYQKQKRAFLLPAPPLAKLHPQRKNRELFKYVALDKIHLITSIQKSIEVQILYCILYILKQNKKWCTLRKGLFLESNNDREKTKLLLGKRMTWRCTIFSATSMPIQGLSSRLLAPRYIQHPSLFLVVPQCHLFPSPFYVLVWTHCCACCTSPYSYATPPNTHPSPGARKALVPTPGSPPGRVQLGVAVGCGLPSPAGKGPRPTGSPRASPPVINVTLG